MAKKAKGTEKSVLLAPNSQLEFTDKKISWPKFGSVKFDGNRCVCVGGRLLSRNLKPQPNENLPEALKDLVDLSRGKKLVFDFELYDPDLPDHGSHNSIIMSREKPIPETMGCHIFDVVDLDEWDSAPKTPYRDRYEKYVELVDLHLLGGRYHAVEQVEVANAAEAKMLFEVAVEAGYEGIMLRCPSKPYHHDRATLAQDHIFKFKAFESIDGKIIEVIQRRKLKDGVERTYGPTGHIERVHTKDSYELDEMVGAFKVLFENGVTSEVNYGKGFPHEVRRQHWIDRDDLIGKTVEVRHLKHGAKDGIRIGTILRFRPDKD